MEVLGPMDTLHGGLWGVKEERASAGAALNPHAILMKSGPKPEFMGPHMQTSFAVDVDFPGS